MVRSLFALSLFLSPAAFGANLYQVPAVAMGKKADWKGAAALEKIVEKAVADAGHTLHKLKGDAGKKALACKGNVDCLAKVAAGNDGLAVVIVLWKVKRKSIGEVGVYDIATGKKLGGGSGKVDAALGAAVIKAIPAPPPPPPPAPEPAAAAAAAPEAAPKSAPEAAKAGAEAPAVPAASAEAPAEAEAVAAAVAAPEVAAPAAPPGKGGKMLSYGLIGGGLAMVGGGAFFGQNALAEHEALKALPEGTERDTKIGKMKEAALLADVLLWPGLVAAGTGAYLLLK